MQTKLAVAALTVAVLLLLAFGHAPTAAGEEARKVVEVVYVPEPSLSPAQIIWLARLMQCESGLKAEALNPADTNGLPSRGILQFQDATFASFTVKYGISADVPVAEAQVEIVTYWLLNPGEVRFSQQFPLCVEKLGQPPGSALANS